MTAPLAAQHGSGVVYREGGRSDLVFAVPALRAADAAREPLTDFVVGCRGSIDVSTADSAAVLALRPSPLALGALRPEDVVEITVVPRGGTPINCGDREAARWLLAERGLWVAFDSVVGPDRRLSEVSVRRGTRSIELAAHQRVPMRRLGPDGLRSFDGTSIRVLVALRELMPDSTGRVSDLVIEVRGGSGSAPDRFTVEWEVIGDLWDALSPLRAARLPATPILLELESPRDTALRRARDLFRASASAEAAGVAARALQRGELSSADQRYARAQNAVLFAEAGDTLAARVNLQQLLRLEPCFTWNEAAPASVRGLTQSLTRSPARCDALTLPMVALRSVALPGFGRPGTGERDWPYRVGVSVLVVGTIVSGNLLGQQARDRYDEYLGAQVQGGVAPVQPNVTRLYDRAESSRKLGQMSYWLAAATWGGQAVLNVWRERQLAQRLSTVQEYGAARQSSHLAPVLRPAASGIGLGLEVRW